jgi:hypothetical protein
VRAKNQLKVGAVLTSGSIGFKKWWVVESVKNSFAELTRLEWSRDVINEPGIMRRADENMRRKVKEGMIYDKRLGALYPAVEGIRVLATHDPATGGTEEGSV